MLGVLTIFMDNIWIVIHICFVIFEKFGGFSEECFPLSQQYSDICTDCASATDLS